MVENFDHFKFSGFSHIVNLTGSFILGLAFLYKKINLHELYETALAEELFQIKKSYYINFIYALSFLSLIIWLNFAFHSSCWVPYKNILLD